MGKLSKEPSTLYQFTLSHDQALRIARLQMINDGAPEEYADRVLAGPGARTRIYSEVRASFDIA